MRAGITSGGITKLVYKKETQNKIFWFEMEYLNYDVNLIAFIKKSENLPTTQLQIDPKKCNIG